MPLPFFASARFLLSGGLLGLACWWRGDYVPQRRELIDAFLSGVLILDLGNGRLILAAHYIPSGMAALLVAATPFWMAGIDALFPRGERIHRCGHPSLSGRG